jgi:hypothetical protein
MSCQPDWERSNGRLHRKRCSLDAKRFDARFIRGAGYSCSFHLALVLNVQPF